MRKQIGAGVGVAAGATLLMGGVADAACVMLTCTVDSLADPLEAGHMTLRQAITGANATPGSTISFATGLSGTIGIAPSQLPTITSPTTISGPGADQIAVSGGNNYRVFETNSTGVTISGLTITGGLTGTSGAGIRSDGGSLTISNAVVTGNHTFGGSTDGGGISVQDGTLTVTASTISGNTAGDRGGGINTEEYGAEATTITSSTISGNQSGGPGGGAYLAYQSPAYVDDSTIYGNTAGSSGGGFYHFGAPNPTLGLTVTGSTFTHNSAARGGGIASFGSANHAKPVLRNTIVAGNTSADGPDLSANSGSMSAAFSLIGNVDTGTTINPTGPDIFGEDPQLGPLAGNGGSTQTQKPAASSPVVDTGSAFGLTADQRGLSRPFDFPGVASPIGGDGSDVGAVELQAADVPLTEAPTSIPTTPTTTPTRKKCKKRHKRSAESAKTKKCKKKRKK
jgi:hypothetical protein